MNSKAKLDTSERGTSVPPHPTNNPESIHISKLRKMAWEIENVGFAYVKACRRIQYVFYEKWSIIIKARIGGDLYFLHDFINPLECEKIWTHIKIKKIRQIEEQIKDLARQIVGQQYQEKLYAIENIRILP